MAHGDTDPPAAPAKRVRVWHAGLTPASAVLIVGAVVAAFVLRNMFVEAHRIVGWVVACAIVALLIDELVDVVERVLPRWVSVIVVLLGVLTIVAGITIGVANNVLDSLDELQTNGAQGRRRARGTLRLGQRHRRRRPRGILRRRVERSDPRACRHRGCR